MKQELVEWEKEERERRDKELAIQQGQQILSLAEVAREKSTPERVSFVIALISDLTVLTYFILRHYHAEGLCVDMFSPTF